MILAIDTATRWTGLALYDGANAAVIAEIGWSAMNTQTVELAHTVEDMFRRTNSAITDLDGIAVAIGPGSYTGLRVGLGFAKGIALVHDVPLIGVSTLDILAKSFHGLPSDADQLVIVCEAGRKRVCSALYRWKEQQWTQADHADIYEWATLIEQTEPGTAFAGEMSLWAREMLEVADKQFTILSPAHSARRAGYLAEIGFYRWQHGEVDEAASLVPRYLRGPAGEKMATI